MGMPIDIIEMSAVLHRIDAAAARARPFVISTPNVNFLANCEQDAEFRESLLRSDLSPADGMPIIYVARLLGYPIKRRIPGSDILEALKTRRLRGPLKVFLLGGEEGVAAMACRVLNLDQRGLTCVGSFYPGFGTIETMSSSEVIDRVNASDADLLLVSLSAYKGQLWLLRNHHCLRIPIRANFGAAMSFTAGRLQRAPSRMQKMGLEWLWRIKAEPYLWRRYWRDGRVLLRLLFTHVLPLATWNWWQQWRGLAGVAFNINEAQYDGCVTLTLSGAATAANVDQAITYFSVALLTKKPIVLDWSDICVIDARFLGLVLMLRKCAITHAIPLTLRGVSPQLARLFRLNGADHLLST
jgi:N-acetylglucosaminyldiphosphoundecaprenol N-acetyl-beta-D-mannosaminyltransferase